MKWNEFSYTYMMFLWNNICLSDKTEKSGKILPFTVLYTTRFGSVPCKRICETKRTRISQNYMTLTIFIWIFYMYIFVYRLRCCYTHFENDISKFCLILLPKQFYTNNSTHQNTYYYYYSNAMYIVYIVLLMLLGGKYLCI